MKKMRFPYSISFGKWDEVYAEIDVELSEEEVEMLTKAAKEDHGMGFSKNETVQEIYDTAYFAVTDSIMEDLRRDPSPVIDMLEWEAEDEDEDEDEDENESDMQVTEEQMEQYIDELYITVYYPEGLRD